MTNPAGEACLVFELSHVAEMTTWTGGTRLKDTKGVECVCGWRIGCTHYRHRSGVHQNSQGAVVVPSGSPRAKKKRTTKRKEHWAKEYLTSQ